MGRLHRDLIGTPLNLNLVLAARVKHGQDHQIRIGEHQLFSAGAGRFGCSRQESQVLAAGKFPEMLEANPGQADDFILGEELLA
jgi:hypothetical protein